MITVEPDKWELEGVGKGEGGKKMIRFNVIPIFRECNLDLNKDNPIKIENHSHLMKVRLIRGRT